MFEDLRKTLHSKLAAQPNGHGPVLFPVQTAKALLSKESRQQVLTNLQDPVLSFTNDFEAYYLTTIHNFAEFVQSLPETDYGPYQLPGDFLDHGLERAAIVLTLGKNLLLAAENSALKQNASLWLYALFTVALLKDTGKIAEQFIVTLCNATGKAIKIWEPFAGSMVGKASHYQFSFTDQYYPRIRKNATFYLVRQLLPVEGFNWLTTNKAIFDTWLALLEDDARDVGSLAGLIPIAEAQLLNKRLAQQREPRLLGSLKLAASTDSDITAAGSGDSHIRPASFAPRLLPLTKAQQTARETALAYDFIAWLKKQLAAKGQKARTMNQPNSAIHVVNEGLLLLPEVFKDFAKDNKQNPLYRDWRTIYREFTQFALVRGTTDPAMYRYFVEQNAKKLSGIIINPYLVLPKTMIPPVNPFLVKISKTMTDRSLGNYISKPSFIPKPPQDL